MLLEKVDPLLIVFHKLTSWEPGAELEHQPPSSHPYLTLLHNASLPDPKLYNHFPNSASLKYLRFLIARPPEWEGEHTLDQFTKLHLERGHIYKFEKIRRNSAGSIRCRGLFYNAITKNKLGCNTETKKKKTENKKV